MLSTRPWTWLSIGLALNILSGCILMGNGDDEGQDIAPVASRDVKLLRCGFLGYEDHLNYLTIDVSRRTLSLEAQADLRRIAIRAEAAGPKGMPGFTESVMRSYHVHLPGSQIGDKLSLVVCEMVEDSRVLVSVLPRVRSPIPASWIEATPREATLLELRQLAYSRLRRDQARPFWALPWHDPALVALLGSGAADDGAVTRKLLGDWPDRPRSFDLALLAAERLDSFSTEDLERLKKGPRIELHVMTLARQALDGTRKALEELLVLSVEYIGIGELFDECLQGLFPRDINRTLYDARDRAAGSSRARGVFLGLIRDRLSEATFESSGWRLP